MPVCNLCDEVIDADETYELRLSDETLFEYCSRRCIAIDWHNYYRHLVEYGFVEEDRPLSKFSRWLQGMFACTGCGKMFKLKTFGFGRCICPTCYAGETAIIYLNASYWLNRLLLLFQGC